MTTNLKMPSVSIIYDFAEEGWLSMDQVAERLYGQLAENFADALEVRRVAPKMLRLPGSHRGTKLARSMERAFNRYLYYPAFLHLTRCKADIFHVIDHSYANLVHHLPARRTVVTCHDVDAFRCLTDPHTQHRPWPFRRISQRLLSGMQKAAAIVCVSQATRDELMKRNLVDPERTHVVHNGIGPIFSPEPDFTADLEAERLVGAREAGVVEILHVGSAVPRKRLDVLLEVLSEIRRSGERVRLIRVGPAFPPQWQPLADRLAAEDAIRSLSFVSSGVLAALYRRASLLLQTSEAEGFGLPLAEAMACGTLAIASDIPVLREVGGKAALYCPTGNISIWADTVSSLIKQSREKPAEFARRRRAAIAQAARFSCRAHAARMLEVYATVTGPIWPNSSLTSALDEDARMGLCRPRCGASRISLP